MRVIIVHGFYIITPGLWDDEFVFLDITDANLLICLSIASLFMKNPREVPGEQQSDSQVRLHSTEFFSFSLKALRKKENNSVL